MTLTTTAIATPGQAHQIETPCLQAAMQITQEQRVRVALFSMDCPRACIQCSTPVARVHTPRHMQAKGKAEVKNRRTCERLDHIHVLWSLCTQEYIVHKYTLMMEQLLQTSAFQEGVVERLSDSADPLPVGLRPPSANETVGLSPGTRS